MVTFKTMSYVCPRCNTLVEGEDYYGPCASCRDDLRLQWNRQAVLERAVIGALCRWWAW